MKILVVEDDRRIAKSLELLFSSCNYAVDLAEDGETGLEMAELFEYDLVLLDILLPGLDGISICQKLRAKGFRYPILLLTGQGGAQQKAIALNIGADDYVVKPFDSDELIARVQALLRRGRSPNQPILTWGKLVLDPSCSKVDYDSRLLTLTPKEYAILELLLRNSQRAFNARALLEHAWNSIEFPGEETIRGHIKELRRKLINAGAPRDWIKTRHRVGYCLNPAYESAQTAETPDQQVSQTAAAQIAALKSVNQGLQSDLERLQAEYYQAHAQWRAQWQVLFDQVWDAIAILDSNGQFIEANPAACKLFGVSKAQLLGSNLADSVELAGDFAPFWQQVIESGKFPCSMGLHGPDGTIKQVELRAIAPLGPSQYLLIWQK